MAKILFEVDGGSQVGGHFEIHSWELMRAHVCAFECAGVMLHMSGAVRETTESTKNWYSRLINRYKHISRLTSIYRLGHINCILVHIHNKNTYKGSSLSDHRPDT